MMSATTVERVRNSMKEKVLFSAAEMKVMVFHPGRKKMMERVERE